MRTEIFRGTLLRVAGVIGAAVFSLVVLALMVRAQTIEADGFRVPEYFEPPHQAQMKSLLEGAKAEPLSGGQILIHSGKLQTFHENGEQELAVEMPLCVFDSVQRTVSTSGPFRARSGDGKLYLEGKGVLCQLTNSSLIVSNRVRTVVQGSWTNAFTP